MPVLLVDGVLVALAYLLAFRLRFDNTVHGRYEDLFEATIPWVVPVSLVSLYAYVNPVIAVVLGRAIGGEKLTARILWAAAVIVLGVAVISTRKPAPIQGNAVGRRDADLKNVSSFVEEV